MERKVLIIYNPKAGAKRKLILKNELKKYARFKYDYVETQFRYHATELAQKAINENYNLIVAAGGDGTINEIATVLSKSNVVLGIIPMGSGNGLARHLNIPLDLRKAIEFIENAKSIKIDEGNINGKSFFCVGGIGFDAEVSKLFAASKTRGLQSYIRLGFQKYIAYTSKIYSIKIDGKQHIEKALLLSFANTAQFGNNAFISPKSIINDGLLDLCVLKPFPFYAGISLFFRLFNKNIAKSSYYKSYLGKTFEIENNLTTAFHCDGEIYETNENIKVTIDKEVLAVLCHL